MKEKTCLGCGINQSEDTMPCSMGDHHEWSLEEIDQEDDGLDYKKYTEEEQKARSEAYRLTAKNPIDRLPEDEYNLMEEIIGLWSCDLHERLNGILRPLTDEQLQKQYEIFSKLIHEDDFSTRITIYDELAKEIKSELIWRPVLKEASEYLENTGAFVYCFFCQKDCSKEEHNANCMKSNTTYIPEPEEHHKYNKMSRDELLVLIKQLTPVVK